MSFIMNDTILRSNSLITNYEISPQKLMSFGDNFSALDCGPPSYNL